MLRLLVDDVSEKLRVTSPFLVFQLHIQQPNADASLCCPHLFVLSSLARFWCAHITHCPCAHISLISFALKLISNGNCVEEDVPPFLSSGLYISVFIVGFIALFELREICIAFYYWCGSLVLPFGIN